MKRILRWIALGIVVLVVVGSLLYHARCGFPDEPHSSEAVCRP